MPGVFWKKEEIEYVKEKCRQNLHPKTYINDFNETFPPGRSIEQLMKRCRVLGFSTSALVPPKIEDPGIQVEYDRRIQELTNLYKSYRDKYERVLDGLNIQDQLIAAGTESIKALPPVKQPAFPKRTDKKITEQAVLLLSDTHFGEVVRADQMRDLNEYNLDIANRRIKHLINTVIDLSINKMVGYRFDRLNIFMLGDMICGNIHEELSESSEGNVMDWTVNVAYILAQAVQELLTTFEIVDITGVVGNHGRTQKQVRFKDRYVNWDFAAYQYLSLFLAEEIKVGKVICRFPTSFWTTREILGWNWLILHGDDIRGWAGIPWYGITRAVHRLTEMLAVKGESFQYMALGHFHNQGTLDRMRGRQIINGSVIGGTEYSIGKMYTTSEAKQFFCGIHPNEGISWEYHINLQGREKKVENPYVMAELHQHSLGELA